MGVKIACHNFEFKSFSLLCFYLRMLYVFIFMVCTSSLMRMGSYWSHPHLCQGRQLCHQMELTMVPWLRRTATFSTLRLSTYQRDRDTVWTARSRVLDMWWAQHFVVIVVIPILGAKNFRNSVLLFLSHILSWRNIYMNYVLVLIK